MSEEPAAEAEEPAAEEPEEPAAAEEAGEPVAEAGEETPEETAEPVAEGDEAAAPDGEERPRGKRKESDKKGSDEELIPGAHLEPDLVLEEEPRPQSEFGEYAEVDETAGEPGEDDATGEAGAEAEPVVHEPIALAADARYAATGKRKSAVARVILKPGEGTYTINNRHLDEYFPRIRLQRMAPSHSRPPATRPAWTWSPASTAAASPRRPPRCATASPARSWRPIRHCAASSSAAATSRATRA